LNDLTLAKGEKVLWSGHPPRRIRSGSWGSFIIACTPAVVVIPVCIHLLGASSGLDRGDQFSLYAVLPMVFYLSFAGAIEVWHRLNTAYVVTTHRAVIARGGFGGRVTSIDLSTLQNVRVQDGPDGTGSIVFSAQDDIPRGTVRREPMVPMFEQIVDVQRVYALIRRASSEASGQ
jgi:Bacterial PH domain